MAAYSTVNLGLPASVAFLESEEADVRKISGQMGLPVRWAMGNPDLVRAFGDVTAMPTLFLFDAEGQAAGAFFGAPPSLHADVEQKLAPLLK